MGHETFSRKGNWGVLVKKMKRGEWEAFVRMLPVPGLHGGYVAEGELVPGGPYENRDAARTAGEIYVTLKNRQ
jgi:hypothetical protein